VTDPTDRSDECDGTPHIGKRSRPTAGPAHEEKKVRKQNTLLTIEQRPYMTFGRIATLGTVVAALALSACGSSGSSSSTAASNGARAASSTTANASSSCAQTAAAKVKAALTPPKMQLPAAFDASKVAGKQLWLIAVSAASGQTADMAAGFTEAAKAAGVKAIVFDGKGTPDLMNQGVSSAIAAHAAAIVLLGIEPELVSGPVADAAKAKIPVISMENGDLNAPKAAGVIANLTYDGLTQGALQADYMLANTNCKASLVNFSASGLTGPGLITKGMQQEVKSLCPSCHFSTTEVQPADIPTKLTPAVENTLQTKPSTNAMLTVTDSMVPFILQGATATGKKLPLIGAGGNTLAEAQKGSGETADVVSPPLGYLGYLALDAAMKASVGGVANIAVPQWIVDKSNWGTTANGPYANFSGYQSAFKSNWASH
jgi:ABC-type sugar transport system substrate-binding protein